MGLVPGSTVPPPPEIKADPESWGLTSAGVSGKPALINHLFVEESYRWG